MADFCSYLSQLLDSASFSIDPAELLAASATPFASVPHPPLAVASPANLTQLKEIFALCAENHVAIRIQGAGTAILPPRHPENEWLLLKTRRMAKIISFEPENHQICLQGGVTFGDLQKILIPYNLNLTNDSHHPLATIGGILAQNLLPPDFPVNAGVAAKLLNLTVLTGDSEVFTFNGMASAPAQLSPEPPLAHVFCGSAGQFGLILNASFALSQRPAVVLLQAAQTSLQRLLHISQQIFHACLPVIPLLLDEAFAELLTGKKVPLLLLKITGSKADTENCLATLEQICEPVAALQTPPLPDLPLPHFLATALVYPELKRSINIQCAPPARLSAMLEAVEEIARQHQLEMHFFGYPNLARIYFSFAYKKEEQWAKAEKDLFALKLVLGNYPNLEDMLGENENDWKNKSRLIGAKLKKIFDPNGLFI